MSKPAFEEFIKERTNLIRIKVVCPMDRSNEILSSLYDAGWHVTESGPHFTKSSFPKVDGSRARFIAEIELDRNSE